MTATRVQVPGKVMLAGEYSVLTGGEAMACTVDLFLTVTARLLPGLGGCRVASDLWPSSRLIPAGTPLHTAWDDPLLAAVALGMELYDISDAEITVESQLAVTFGVGSSSALRLAVLLALQDLQRQRQGLAPLPRTAQWPAARSAWLLQRQAQQQASGYDIATQLCGGLVRFRSGDEASWPCQVTPAPAAELAALCKLVHVYVGGAGAPTTQVMRAMAGWLDDTAWREALAAVTVGLQAALGAALAAPEQAPAQAQLAAATGAHRRHFAAAPHFPAFLAQRLAAVAGHDSSWSWKPTGAGGEDALLLFGTAAATAQPAAALRTLGWRSLPAPFTMQGAALTRPTESGGV